MPPAIKVALEARVLRNKGRRYYCDESPSLPTSLRARTTPHALTVRPPVVRVLGSSKAGLPTCGWSMRRNFLIGSILPVPALRRAASGKSLLCDALSQPHSPCGKCPRNEGHFRPCEPNVASNSHASQLTRRIHSRLQQASQPSQSWIGRRETPRWFAPRFNSPRKPPRTSDAYSPAAFVRLIVNRSRLR
jgi:hypothetical protein